MPWWHQPLLKTLAASAPARIFRGALDLMNIDTGTEALALYEYMTGVELVGFRLELLKAVASKARLGDKGLFAVSHADVERNPSRLDDLFKGMVEAVGRAQN